MEKTNSEKNKQDSFVIADSPTTSFYLKKKQRRKKLQQIYMKSPPEDLSDEHKMMK